MKKTTGAHMRNSVVLVAVTTAVVVQVVAVASKRQRYAGKRNIIVVYL